MSQQNLYKSIINILIFSIFLFSLFRCSSTHELVSVVKEKYPDGVNLLILFSSFPRTNDESFNYRGLNSSNLSNQYMEQFCFYTPSLIKNSMEMDSIDIQIRENISFINSEPYKINGDEKINIYSPDMKEIKNISKRSNIALIFQELTVVVVLAETDLYSRYVNKDGLPGYKTKKDVKVPYLVSLGIFSLWDINDARLLDFGKFGINSPMYYDLSKTWITSFKKIINESIIKTTLIQHK